MRENIWNIRDNQLMDLIQVINRLGAGIDQCDGNKYSTNTVKLGFER